MNKPEARATSALDLQPADTIREVSAEAITYFVSKLGDIYLPDGFAAQNSQALDVERWDKCQRLRGKFGRFVVSTEDGDRVEPDVLLMGTTIGLRSLDRFGYLQSLRHYEFHDLVYGAMVRRGLSESERLRAHAVDYGATEILLDDDGAPTSIKVSGSSLDYGRAGSVERAITCVLFQQLLDAKLGVINADPEPRAHDRIIR